MPNRGAQPGNKNGVTHGLSKTVEFHIWGNIRYRCNNPRSKDYPDYGARGIVVDPRWDSFEQFLADMGPRPSGKHSIDRINNDGPYSKENCRWATQSQQRSNARGRQLTHNGKTQNTIDWAREMGLNYGTLLKRLKNGWSTERALTGTVDRRFSTYGKRKF